MQTGTSPVVGCNHLLNLQSPKLFCEQSFLIPPGFFGPRTYHRCIALAVTPTSRLVVLWKYPGSFEPRSVRTIDNFLSRFAFTAERPGNGVLDGVLRRVILLTRVLLKGLLYEQLFPVNCQALCSLRDVTLFVNFSGFTKTFPSACHEDTRSSGQRIRTK